jgi:hypothetical protein
MVLLKNFKRTKPPTPLAALQQPRSEQRLLTPIEPNIEAQSEHDTLHQKSKVMDPDEQLARELQNAVDVPTPTSPKSSADTTEDEPKRLRRKKGCVGHTTRLPRPPFLPPHMRNGCVQTTKFKSKTAPGAPKGRDGWESFNYCLDCLRDHKIIYCDGVVDFKKQACRYHEQQYVFECLNTRQS